MLRSDKCDYSDACIVVKGRISDTGTNNGNRRNKKINFKNNAPFRSCIAKINNTLIGNVEDLDILILMYNLLEYSDNYSITSGTLSNDYTEEVNDDVNKNNDNDYRINNEKTTTSKTFEYKTKIIGSTPNNNSSLDEEGVTPLKHLRNFWRFLNLLLTNCKIVLDLT